VISQSYRGGKIKTRIPEIFSLIKTSKPKAVVLYFLSQKTENFISDLCSTHFGSPLKSKNIGKQRVLYNVYDQTALYFIKHVNAAAGMSNEDLCSIAEDVMIS
jgi:hypothetical protein